MLRATLLFPMVFLVWIVPAEAQDKTGLTVVVEAPRSDLVIQPDKELLIRITVKNNRGQGIGGMRLETDCSIGSLSKVEDQGAGRYRAFYRVPNQRHPQAVLVAARVAGSVPGFAVIPLRARTDLAVNTDKPRVHVTLSVAGRRYGPVVTDENGQVKIPIEIGPGETSAVAEAVDEFGNRTSRPVNISIPPSPGLVGFVERSELAADGEDYTNLYLIAISPSGEPATKASFTAKKTSGALAAIQRLSAGVFRIRYTAPAGLKTAVVQIAVSDPSNPLSVRNFQVRLSVGQPDHLIVEVDPQQLTSHRQSVARVVIHVTDRVGALVAGRQPQISCSPGMVTPLAEDGSGKYEASFTPPYGMQGQAKCRATLPRGNRPELQTEATVQLSPPKPASISAKAKNSTLVTDGRSATEIEMMVYDSFGDTLEGVALQVTASIGTLSKVAEQGKGRYLVSYQAPQGTQSENVRVNITTGTEKDAATSVTLSLQGVAPPLPFLQIGPWLGLTTNFKEVQPAFTLEAALRLPFAGSRFYVGLETGYRVGWSEHQTAETGERLTTRLDFLPLHLLVLFKPLPHATFKPFILVGGGAEFVRSSTTKAARALKPGYQTLGGVVAGIGAELKLGVGELFFQARYLYSYLTHTPGPQNVKGNVGGFEIGIGYQLFFFY